MNLKRNFIFWKVWVNKLKVWKIFFLSFNIFLKLLQDYIRNGCFRCLITISYINVLKLINYSLGASNSKIDFFQMWTTAKISLIGSVKYFPKMTNLDNFIQEFYFECYIVINTFHHLSVSSKIPSLFIFFCLKNWHGWIVLWNEFFRQILKLLAD